MYVADDAGLAANQVGVDLRLFVYDCPDDDGIRHVGHLINPVLDLPDPGSRRLLDDFEGCLSVPGATMEVPRTDRLRRTFTTGRTRPLSSGAAAKCPPGGSR
ncbi:peptide deformylase [Streptomyces platensis]